MKRRNRYAEVIETIWEATVACCTALHDIGFGIEEIAVAMPQAQKELGNAITRHCLGGSDGKYRVVLPGDAIKAGQDYAERLAATRAGAQA